MAIYSSEGLLDSLHRLFPHGTTTTLDMATRLSEEGIGNIALSQVKILSTNDDLQDFVVAHLNATYVTPELKVREYSRREFEIVHCLRIPSNSLRFLALDTYPESGLVPGQISPFDVSRLPVEQFRSATFLIAECVQCLAADGVDMILPKGQSFEILSTGAVIDQITKSLSNGWNVVFASGGPEYGFSPHI